jgi:hypothetical protein
MKFEQFKDQLLLGLVGIAVAILFWMASSVATLNTNVAVILEKVANHEDRIKTLEGGK